MQFKYRYLMMAALCLTNPAISSEIVDEPTGILSHVKARCDHIALRYNPDMKDEVQKFYGQTLGLPVKVSKEGNLAIDFLGTTQVFHASTNPIQPDFLTSIVKPVPDLHFGTQSLTLDEFESVERDFKKLGIIINPTKILNPGKDNEERTLFIKDPIGYAIEFRYSKQAINFASIEQLKMDKDKQGFNQ